MGSIFHFQYLLRYPFVKALKKRPTPFLILEDKQLSRLFVCFREFELAFFEATEYLLELGKANRISSKIEAARLLHFRCCADKCAVGCKKQD